jgi:type III pantothenate kinase
MKLLIDAGNTRIKWAVVNDATEWLCSGVLPTAQVNKLAQDIADHLDKYETDLQDIQIWVSNVAGEDIAHHIRNIGVGKSPQLHFIAARESQCGVHNGYLQASQLGSDRWAALIAAWHLVQGKCLVVNSGTATTIDTLAEHGEFMGGIILPGVELMQRNLVAATQLKLTEGEMKLAEGKFAPFPLMSADALYSGAIQASCGAIERQYGLLDDNNAVLVLSGGAAELLHSQLNHRIFNAPLRLVDNLVLRGLLLIAEEVNQP